MLHNAKKMEGYAVAATDGDIGHVKDFYFDDERYAKLGAKTAAGFDQPGTGQK